ncbi:DUF1572 family protein [Halalkalibacterium halodurans]|uniref:DUF1572 domain-containing protein n=1 Tax=Halalkalibacterium halodurans TaxID=86665 RepID=A0A0M0KMA6_ALKHA|nr:DUF1572 family protein [Halalkalibacterium halodurans]TPE67880.1 DUF1572 domain-containing protein [Halalkalibacterium halodurans]
MNIGAEYLNVVIERFQSVKRLGDRTLSQLSNEDIHWSHHDESNSVVIIVKHMSGNMISRWTDFLTTDGEKESRNRDEEFTDDITSKAELMAIWEKGWSALMKALGELQPDDLLKTVTIRGEKHLVLAAIERQVAHYAYHVGQIVYIGKERKHTDWESLSIPKGQSETYLQQMLDKHRSDNER